MFFTTQKKPFLIPAISSITALVSLTLFSPMTTAYSQEDLTQLLTTNKCNNCDLTNADLSGASLYGASIQQSDLAGATLNNALLRSSKLNGSNFTDATLTGAYLNAAVISSANFTNADLSGAILQNIQGDASIFNGATLTNADLNAAVLNCTTPATPSTCVSFTGVQAQSINLNGATLSGANLSSSNFTQGQLRNANLGANANLTGANFCQSDLTEAIMPNDTIYSDNTNLGDFGASDSCTNVKKTAGVTAGSPGAAIDYCPTGVPIFNNPENIQLGITPTVWSNSDDLSIDLVPPIPYQQIMSEIALAGFKGTQNSPKFPSNMHDLLRELHLRDITISEPWVGTFFTLGDSGAAESQRIFDEQVKFMKLMRGDVIVVAEMGAAVHQQPIAPIPNRPRFSRREWKILLEGLNDIGQQAHEQGMKLVYHYHIGTGVESMADIDKLMNGTNPEYVHLLLDTGHAKYAGVDPLELTKKYADRIAHVHLKNIRQDVLTESLAQGWSFLNSVREGVFTVPGDSAGSIDFDPILQTLADHSFQGWLVVEAEQDPNKANPLKYALMARDYLCTSAGL